MGIDVQQEQCRVVKCLVVKGVSDAQVCRRMLAVFNSETLSRSRVLCSFSQRMSISRRWWPCWRAAICSNGSQHGLCVLWLLGRYSCWLCAFWIILQWMQTTTVHYPQAHYVASRPSKASEFVTARYCSATRDSSVVRQSRKLLWMMGWELLQHPSYTLDLVPGDFHPYGPLKVSGRTWIWGRSAACPKVLPHHRQRFLCHGLRASCGLLGTLICRENDYVEKW